MTALHLAINNHGKKYRDAASPVDSREILALLIRYHADLNKGVSNIDTDTSLKPV